MNNAVTERILVNGNCEKVYKGLLTALSKNQDCTLVHFSVEPESYVTTIVQFVLEGPEVAIGKFKCLLSQFG